MKTFADIAFTPRVQALQTENGSRAAYARMAGAVVGGLGDREAEFLVAADSFYLASVGETGWPYVQHRGGPTGFVKVLSATRIAFADFRGNRQYVSAGNADSDDRVALIVMDYANRRRLKLLGRLTFLAAESAGPSLLATVSLPGYAAKVERVALIEVEAFDWNCPQHITERYTATQVEAGVAPLHTRIAQLEVEAGILRQRLADREINA